MKFIFNSGIHLKIDQKILMCIWVTGFPRIKQQCIGIREVLVSVDRSTKLENRRVQKHPHTLTLY